MLPAQERIDILMTQKRRVKGRRIIDLGFRVLVPIRDQSRSLGSLPAVIRPVLFLIGPDQDQR